MGMEFMKIDVIEKSLKEYLKYHPADLDTLMVMAELLLESKSIDQADEELMKVFLFDPENQRAAALMNKIRTYVF